MNNQKSSKKIALVTTLAPETSYGRYLGASLKTLLGNDLAVYADKNEDNLKIQDCGLGLSVWRKNSLYLLDILKRVIRDRPDIVHLQHEINTYGGELTALLFPWLIALLRMLGIKIVVTIHAVVGLEQVDDSFVKKFKEKSSIIRPLPLKLFFIFLYKTVGLFSNRIIVHTRLMRALLISEYKLKADKVTVIPHGVPIVENYFQEKSQSGYLLYFGYLVRRKGLKKMVKGFLDFVNHSHSEAELILAGGAIKGQEFARDEIIKFTKKLDSKGRIKFLGFVEGGEISRLFTKAYAVVVPAEISISASGPLAQAFSYGKCVIASGVGNLKEEIVNETDGLLVSNDNWSAVFERAWQEKALVKKIEMKAYEKAQERDWEKIAQKHLDVYNKLRKE